MKTNYKIAAVTLLAAVGLCVVACGGREPHTHIYVEHEEVLSNCAETGTEFYYTCEGCDQFFDADHNEISGPVVIPADPTNHKGTEFLAVGGTYKNQYTVGETFDKAGLVLTAKCEYCEGRVLSPAEMERVTVAYPTADATEFTADDAAKDDLKVTLTYGNLHAEAPINNVNKKDNAITGLKVIEQHCGYKPFATLDGVSATYGQIVYTFSETEQGEYKTAAELGAEYEFKSTAELGEDKSTTYYVKATVEEGPDYEGVEEKTTIVITHNDLSWDTTRDDYDFYGCVCQDPYVFNKVPTNAKQEVDVASAALDLSGTGFDSTQDTVKSITFIKSDTVSFDLGTDVSNLDFSEVDPENHGEGRVEVVVTGHQEGSIPAIDHTIKIDLLAVTNYISTADEFFDYVMPKAYTDAVYTERFPGENGASIFGYFKLKNDISILGSTTNPRVTGTNIFEARDGNKTNYFGGTLDGNNKTITTTSNPYGLLHSVKNAKIKSITINDAWYRAGATVNYSLVARDIYNVVFDDCNFKATNNLNQGVTPPNLDDRNAQGYLNTAQNGRGWLATRNSQLLTFNNCDFTAGTNLRSLLAVNTSVTEATFANCNLTCTKYCMLYYSDYSKRVWTARDYTEDQLKVTGELYDPNIENWVYEG